MKKLVILTCLWKRYLLTNLFLKAVNRLRRDTVALYDIDIVGVGSRDTTMERLCNKYDVHYLDRPNAPLGQKWNAGLQFARSLDPESILILGSDDILSSNVLAYYSDFSDQGFNFIGLKDLYFLQLKTNRLIYWPGYTNHRTGEAIGVGRMLKSKVLDGVGWKLWENNLNKGLDGSMTDRLKHLHLKTKVLSIKKNDLFALDLKTDINITCFESYRGTTLQSQMTLEKYLPASEVQTILNLCVRSNNTGKMISNRNLPRHYRVVILANFIESLSCVNLFLKNMTELRSATSQITIDVVTVGPDNAKLKEWLTDNNCVYVTSEEGFLGVKLNQALGEIKYLKPDYVMLTETDKFISGSYLKTICKFLMNGYEYIGVVDQYIYHPNSKELIYWRGYDGQRKNEPVRAGRIVSRQILQSLDWKLWDDSANSSIDFVMTQRLKIVSPTTKLIKMHEQNFVVLDIKTNNSEFKKFQGIHQSHDKLSNMLDFECLSRELDECQSPFPADKNC